MELPTNTCPHPFPTVLPRAPHTPGDPSRGSGGRWSGLVAPRPVTGQGRVSEARPRGCAPAPGRPGCSRLARPQRALAGLRRRRRGSCAPSASREHKQGEEAGVSAWARCQRAGAGTQCPERAGERAGSENSLTQQLGKWVCSLTRSTALAACGQRLPDSRRLPRAGGASAPPASRLPPCLSLGTSTWLVCASLCLLAPPLKLFAAPSPSRAGSAHLGGALSSPHPAGVTHQTAAGYALSHSPTTLGCFSRSWRGGCNP
nr:uncharacterized protein LOC132431562 [Delphinus delphis]XP_059877297.1 uncharacterized protein LOC132431562 [Delphinus delphis]